MKITRRQLRQLINEELSRLDEAFEIKKAGSQCQIGRTKSIVVDMTDWTKPLYKNIIKAIGVKIKPDDISYELMHSICENLVPNHFPSSSYKPRAGVRPSAGLKKKWDEYEKVWGPLDEGAVFGYTVENGKATFDPSLGESPPPQDYDKNLITKRVQDHLDHFGWLKTPGVKLQIGIIRYQGKKE